MTRTLTVRRGSLYLAREDYDHYLAGVESVVVLRRDDDILVLPVRNAAAGGYLIKRRNRAGDRVINAADFFRQNGIEDEVEREIAFSWSADLAALVLPAAFTL